MSARGLRSTLPPIDCRIITECRVRCTCLPAPTGGNGCPPATSPAVGADTWVRPYGWSRAHPPHRIPHPRRAGEGGFQTRPYRRERLSASNIAYRRADTWVRPYGWSRAHPPHRIPHPHRAGEGGFRTRAYRRERLSASNIAYGRADTWVRPYGWSRAHPPHPIPLPPVTRGEGVRCELSGCVVGFGVYQGGERPGVVESMGAP